MKIDHVVFRNVVEIIHEYWQLNETRFPVNMPALGMSIGYWYAGYMYRKRNWSTQCWLNRNNIFAQTAMFVVNMTQYMCS